MEDRSGWSASPQPERMASGFWVHPRLCGRVRRTRGPCTGTGQQTCILHKPEVVARCLWQVPGVAATALCGLFYDVQITMQTSMSWFGGGWSDGKWENGGMGFGFWRSSGSMVKSRASSDVIVVAAGRLFHQAAWRQQCLPLSVSLCLSLFHLMPCCLVGWLPTYYLDRARSVVLYIFASGVFGPARLPIFIPTQNSGRKPGFVRYTRQVPDPWQALSCPEPNACGSQTHVGLTQPCGNPVLGLHT